MYVTSSQEEARRSGQYKPTAFTKSEIAPFHWVQNPPRAFFQKPKSWQRDPALETCTSECALLELLEPTEETNYSILPEQQ